MNRNLVLLALAMVAFILAAVAAQDGEEILLNGLAWLGVGGALSCASRLP